MVTPWLGASMSSCKPPTANGGLGMTALDTLYHALIHVHHPHSYASLTGGHGHSLDHPHACMHHHQLLLHTVNIGTKQQPQKNNYLENRQRF
jgi:hypothetical protein